MNIFEPIFAVIGEPCVRFVDIFSDGSYVKYRCKATRKNIKRKVR